MWPAASCPCRRAVRAMMLWNLKLGQHKPFLPWIVSSGTFSQQWENNRYTVQCDVTTTCNYYPVSFKEQQEKHLCVFNADIFEPWLAGLWMGKIIFLSQAPLLPKAPELDCLAPGHYCSIWEAWFLKQTIKHLIGMCPQESLTYPISRTEILACSTHIRHPLFISIAGQLPSRVFCL